MICKTCGREIPDNYVFCSYCGTNLKMVNVNQGSAAETPMAAPEPAAPAFPADEEPAAPAFPVEDTPMATPEVVSEPAAPAFPVDEEPVAPAFPVDEEPAASEDTIPEVTTPENLQESFAPEPVSESVSESDTSDGTMQEVSQEMSQDAPQEMTAPAFPVDDAPPVPTVDEPFSAVTPNQEPQQNTISSDLPAFNQTSIPQNVEIDPEAGTTVLTAGMSGPLTSETNNAKPKYEKIVTPAPVTNSNILSDSGVLPVTPTVQAQNYYGGVQNNAYTAPSMNNMQNSYPVNNQMNNQTNNDNLITPWGYVGYTLLFCIPILGVVMLLVYAFGDGHSQNLKNYARGQLLMIVIAIAIEVIMLILMAILGVSLFGALR